MGWAQAFAEQDHIANSRSIKREMLKLRGSPRNFKPSNRHLKSCKTETRNPRTSNQTRSPKCQEGAGTLNPKPGARSPKFKDQILNSKPKNNYPNPKPEISNPNLEIQTPNPKSNPETRNAKCQVGGGPGPDEAVERHRHLSITSPFSSKRGTQNPNPETPIPKNRAR